MNSTTDAHESGVRVERRGAFSIWTLDRPDRMNALSRAAVYRLGELARELATDPDVRVVVLTGAGDRAFCAGADLKERTGMGEQDVRDFLGLYRAVFDAIARCPKPVVAAINGVAFGGGLELALACDLRIMAHDARVGLTEVSLAIIPGAGGTQRLTRLLGEAKAKELILLARKLDAQEALALGVVGRVAPVGTSVLDAALEWLAPLAEAAPIAVSAALEAIDSAFDLPLDAGLLHERRCYERTLSSEDRLEALAAFHAKRKPVYRGC
ncbi:MAG: enoyl-CoA hydratase [Deltaproteobacteria bacterium]|nr:enoyl-CoA hydratase [Deltaproteobacteria bacterium]